MKRHLVLLALLSLGLSFELGAVDGPKPGRELGAGETVEGLQASLSAVREVFGAGESPKLQFTLRNLGTEPLTLNFEVFDNHTPCFGADQYKLLRDGKEVPMRNDLRQLRPVTVFQNLTLGPGSTTRYEVDVCALALEGEPFAAPGKYELTLTFVAGPLRVATGKAEFQVVAAKVETPKERISRLVEKLGGDEYAERESAQKELQKLGVPALPALYAAKAKSDDAEVRARCTKLIMLIAPTPETEAPPAPPAHLEF